MTLIHEDLAGRPPEYWRHVLKTLKIELFYAGIRIQAAERRAKNPGAYALPPGHQPLGWCPCCGQPVANAPTIKLTPSDSPVYHAPTTNEGTSAQD
jgi:hypothetical protein